MIHLGNDWDAILSDEFNKDYYHILKGFLANEYKCETIYPNMYDIFNAFKTTSYADTKIVIIGQDPYHQPNQAHGLCFSVKDGVRLPPSLKNVYREINNDLGIQMSNSGNLMPWAQQGVLLLNTLLTVREGKPMSHKGYGWEQFNNAVLEILNKRDKPIIFMLWGNPAKEKEKFITNPNHIILKASHPSPLGAYHGFFGCKHFSKANEILFSLGQKPINWKI
ncbi:MAG: uracil-DNA glycosylase [Clostridia bacterium]